MSLFNATPKPGPPVTGVLKVRWGTDGKRCSDYGVGTDLLKHMAICRFADSRFDHYLCLHRKECKCCGEDLNSCSHLEVSFVGFMPETAAKDLMLAHAAAAEEQGDRDDQDSRSSHVVCFSIADYQATLRGLHTGEWPFEKEWFRYNYLRYNRHPECKCWGFKTCMPPPGFGTLHPKP